MYGKANGQGTNARSDGFKYVGGFKDNKPHGQGTLTVQGNGESPGMMATGEWKDGEMHGQITMVVGGLMITAEFKDGERVP